MRKSLAIITFFMVGCGVDFEPIKNDAGMMIDAGKPSRYTPCLQSEIGKSVCANGNNFTCGSFAAWTEKGNFTFSEFPGKPTWIVNGPCL